MLTRDFFVLIVGILLLDAQFQFKSISSSIKGGMKSICCCYIFLIVDHVKPLMQSIWIEWSLSDEKLN